VLIPGVFHQIWVGPDPFPGEYAHYQKTWLNHHPGWELRFWTEDNLPEGLRRPEAAERLRVPAERANILRLELLWRFGGVYVDTDFECRRSIEPLIEEASLFISLAKPARVNSALMGSVAGHPLIDEALDKIRPREFFGHDKAATGVLFVNTLLLGRPDVTFIEPELFHPRTAEARERAYAVHGMARSWKDDPEQLRRDLRKTERQMREAEKSAGKWRARCEQAQADLAELRRSWPYHLSRLSRRRTA
jgi:mannosyltransferase OCH1-like enzyme